MSQTLSRDDLIALVNRILKAEGTADQIDEDVELFLANCKHPAGTDLIFWPGGCPHDATEPEPTAEEIVDKATSYQDMPLSPDQVKRLEGAGLILSLFRRDHVKFPGGAKVDKPKRAGGRSFPGFTTWSEGELCDAPRAHLYGENGRWRCVIREPKLGLDMQQEFDSLERATDALLAFYFGPPMA
jgi:hypothetical protein